MSTEAGLIVAHTSATIPPGWALCDGGTHTSQDLYDRIGSWNVPNLTDRFIRGAGATPIRTVGGQASVALTVAQMPSHNHDGTTVAGGGAHNHTGSTTSNSRGNMSHPHYGDTGGETYNHTHPIPQILSGTVSAWHQHNILVNEGSGSGDGGPYVDTNPSADGSGRPNVGVTNGQTVAHVHASPTQNTGGVTHNHQHYTGVYGTDINHTHSFTSGGPSVGHTHTIQPVGSGTSIPLVPAHYAVTFIICL